MGEEKDSSLLSRLLTPFCLRGKCAARSCKWISDLGNNMFVHSLRDGRVGVVQARSGPAQFVGVEEAKHRKQGATGQFEGDRQVAGGLFRTWTADTSVRLPLSARLLRRRCHTFFIRAKIESCRIPVKEVFFRKRRERGCRFLFTFVSQRFVAARPLIDLKKLPVIVCGEEAPSFSFFLFTAFVSVSAS